MCDKDGVSTAAVLAEMSVALANEGKTIQVHLYGGRNLLISIITAFVGPTSLSQ